MPRAAANGIELEYDSFGSGPAIVLIMGIGTQMIAWDEEFCLALAARGFRVLRFDNRDIGLSTWLDPLGLPRLPALAARAALGLPVQAPYTLSDMAKDTVGLLDHLGLRRAHLVGASMGGMIAQQVAIEAPERLASLTSIMATPGGARHLLGAQPAALRAFAGPRPKSKEEGLDFIVALYRVLHGGQTPFPEARVRARAAEAIARAWHPAGFPRQLAAILASGDRTRALGAVRVPTLVLHGEADPLIPVSAGRATAAAIPGARFQLVPKMGHFLPPEAFDTLVEAIAGHAGAVGG